MDINLGNIGIKTGLAGVNGANAGHVAEKAGASPMSANLTIGARVAGIASGEPVAEVPAEALTRDDKLGMLVDAAFSLPPPPMPDFR